MKKIIKENLSFIIVYLVFLIPSILLIIVFSKQQIHLTLNRYYSNFADFAFLYLTFLGSGLIAIILALILLLVKLRYFLITVLSFTSSSLVVQILKRIIFYDIDRPAEYFKNIVDLHLVAGQQILRHFSFPSGHSATIFAICFSLSYFIKNQYLKVVLAVIAILVAFSRVYLSQHFLIDIVFGSIIGVVFSIISILVIDNIFLKKNNISFEENMLNNDEKN